MFSKHGLVFAVHGLKLLSDSKKRSLHTLKLNKTVPSQTTAPLLEQVLQVDDSSIGLSVFFLLGGGRTSLSEPESKRMSMALAVAPKLHKAHDCWL